MEVGGDVWLLAWCWLGDGRDTGNAADTNPVIIRSDLQPPQSAAGSATWFVVIFITFVVCLWQCCPHHPRLCVSSAQPTQCLQTEEDNVSSGYETPSVICVCHHLVSLCCFVLVCCSFVSLCCFVPVCCSFVSLWSPRVSLLLFGSKLTWNPQFWLLLRPLPLSCPWLAFLQWICPILLALPHFCCHSSCWLDSTSRSSSVGGFPSRRLQNSFCFDGLLCSHSGTFDSNIEGSNNCKIHVFF